MTVQITNLAHSKSSVTKIARVDGSEGEATFTPDSLTWENELDVFRQLRAFSKPSFKNGYSVTDGTKDINSNLLIRSYLSEDNVPVPAVKFFYHRDMHQLKRIEAIYHERNLLYATRRKLILEFEDVNGRPTLNAYRIDGAQKMIFSDTTHFSINATVNL